MGLAQALNRTPAQVVLRWEWQQGVIINPRTQNPQHMTDNLAIFDFALSGNEVATISALQAPTNISKVDPDPHDIP